MSCSSPSPGVDWKAYALGELDSKDRALAEAHAATCSECRHELATIRLTLDSLSTLREEEVPRRIAFVSDKVFEPRWWQSFLRPSFAGACVIALAILAHGWMRPAPSADPAELQAKIDQAVAKAVAQQTENLLADYEVTKKQNTLMYIRNTGMVRQ